ncbi:hypothetical protein AaE_013645 [Aphanomyces astaci]|uniref:FHA domain-containing protein n=1 Tax=Aphanomyces astaci TaxID=112090 RepID=A0A6A4ZHB2_APHAT|nr:hypothetical protein AaE_013645 [Aphanomyces astaci]
MVRSVKRKAARMSSATESNRASAALIDETDHSDGEARNSSTLSEHPTPGKDKPQTMIEYLEAQRNLALHNLQTQRDKALAQFREEAAQAKKKIIDSLAEGKEEAPSADSSSLSHEPPLPSAVKDETQLQHQTTSPSAASSSKPQRTYGEKKTIHIACTSGVYSGQHFTLVLSTDVNRVCLIGRSSGKKYKAPLGLSLPKDPEISTTHAEVDAMEQ